MSDFRQVTPTFWASPQIGLEDVREAHAQGFALIVNNRPDGESEDQVPGEAIAAAAAELGLGYFAIPVTPAGFSEDQVTAMRTLLQEAEGPVLAYCRSGTRSTLLWSLVQAANGRDPDVISAEAAGAGYNLAPVRSIIDRLAERAG